ncbi:hypothetical protein MKW94_004400 [Papaver nudicaule]|uniref:DDT domain-containing protein n=1 Tax=Papaver nudicaule TaxID=74823 RepID=A0AA41VI39_PAPNU|nr:hypothetical protein [Papaver nudicaule]
MPLFKKKPFPLVDSPDDLEPRDLVFQVRFTKEIFKDYQEYLKRINLYRRRIWTCKVTGKVNLTYEEALVSEQRAIEKVQQFPKELMAPVLHIIQFSTLTLRDLLVTISRKLQERLLVEGLELLGRKEKTVFPCKILKVLEDNDQINYEVGWIGKDKKVAGSSVVNFNDLIRRKLPVSREVLKSFIRESTSQSSPWVIHDNLAREHGISTEPPEDSDDNDECLGNNNTRRKKNKRKEPEDDNCLIRRKKAKKGVQVAEEEAIKYPIDDILVKPGADDPKFTDRPPPSRDFSVPEEYVGDLLMVWDFCSSFGRLLHLSPFSLEDFESAICHKDTNLNLIMESHSAFFQLLIKDEGDYFTAVQKKKRKSKITLLNWSEYLCDFLEMREVSEFSTHIATIKRGHYGLLDPHHKLAIFRELIACSLATDAVRDQLDDSIEQQQALASKKRGVALEEGRKRREEKLLKAESNGKEVMNGHSLENGGKVHHYENGSDDKQKGSNCKPNGSSGKHNDCDDKDNGSNSKSNGSNDKQNGDVAQEENIIVYKRKKASGNRERSSAEEPSSNEERKESAKRSRDTRNEGQTKEVLQKEIEKLYVCTYSLGKDKDYNRYWFFRHEGRLFIESSDSKHWGYYSTKEELDAFVGSLNPKGERERALQKQLEKSYDKISSALQKRSKDIATNIALEEAVVRRSTRVHAPVRDNPARAFLRYVNKWKE